MLDGARLAAFVGVKDRARARAFYEGALGLRLVSDDEWAMVFVSGGASLRVTMVREVAAAPYTVAGWTVPDIAAAVDELSAKGVAFERFGFLEQDARGLWTAPGGDQVAWFKDPDGNLLSLSTS